MDVVEATIRDVWNKVVSEGGDVNALAHAVSFAYGKLGSFRAADLMYKMCSKLESIDEATSIKILKATLQAYEEDGVEEHTLTGAKDCGCK